MAKSLPPERPLSLPLWLLVPGALAFFLGLTTFPIYIVDEARNAQAAWEMWQRGDWIVPTFNGGIRSDKPPLHYYGMWLGYLFWGKTALAARLGSALCGLLTVAGLYYFTKRVYDHTTGMLAALTYLLAFYVPLQYHLATPDAYLAACFTLGMLALHRGYTTGHRPWLYSGYLALALATLAKGPVALALAGGGWGLFFLTDWRNLWRNLRCLRPLAGVLIVLTVTLPWYLSVHYATDGVFTEGFFLEHNLRRFGETKEGHGGSPLLILAIVLIGLLPFGAWLPRGLWAATKTPDSLNRLATATVCGVILLFSLSRTKLPSYPFPAYGFAAVVIATWLRRFWRFRGASRSDHWAFGFATLVLLVVPLGVYLGLKQDRVLRELTPLWWQFSFTGAFGIYAIWQWTRRRFTRGLAGLGAGFFALQLFLFVSFVPRLNAYNQVAAAFPLLREAPAFVALGRFAPAYVFAHDAPITRYYAADELAEWLRTAPDGALVLSAERFQELLPPGVDLRPVFRQKDLFEYPTTVIYRYHADE
ncbi:MAG: glycosyltransferase family 39 protein [Bacteroidota bacterium]